MSVSAETAAAEAARLHYGRLVAYLTARFRDLSLAEDALNGALVSALEVWPVRGVPDRPEAWLYQVARRAILDRLRHTKVAEDYARRMAPVLALEIEMESDVVFPDERLRLMYVCAHPALEADIRIALMLQVVLGFEAHQIARAFVVSPATMSQRLVRAKARIKSTGIGFDLPEASEIPERLDSVLSALYAGFGIDWDDVDQDGIGFARECLALTRYVVEVSDHAPEALGLMALMLYSEARKPARFGVDGAFIPLSAQAVSLWDAALLQAAHTALNQALSRQKLGRFQLEAAIQNAHIQSRLSGQDLSAGILSLYDALIIVYPALGAQVARALVLAQCDGAVAGLRALDPLPADRVKAYQPYWAARADLLRQAGQGDDARYAYEVAAGLSLNRATRRYLLAQRDALGSD